MGPPGQGALRLGYNTNGFAHHRLPDALAVIAELGYRSVGLTLDVHHLDPFASGLATEVRAIGERCRDLDLLPVVETGARFLLDPRRKHQPTLLSRDPADRQRRIDFLFRAIEIAYGLSGPPWAPVVSLWSGAREEGDDAAPDELDERLAESLGVVCARARESGVWIGFEPEPGMHVEDMAAFARIEARVAHPALRLTLDVGHAHLTEAAGAEATIRAWAPKMVNCHVEGMRRGTHDHLVPWEGDLDVRGAVRALREAGYRGPATLELSRHSHDAVRVARRAFEYLSGT
jgi:sugar phosphate isomerase/epimerase